MDRPKAQRRTAIAAGVLGVCLSLASSGLTAAGSPLAPTVDGGSTGGVSASRSTLVQDPVWLALKNAGQVVRTGPGQVSMRSVATAQAASYPNSFNLPYSTQYSGTEYTVEPESGAAATAYDDHGTSYLDKNYVNFCVPGATTVAMSYFEPTDVTGHASGNFTEPAYSVHHSTTYWTAADYGGSPTAYHANSRSYIMFMAEQVDPPSYSNPGEVDFSTYPTTGAGQTDARDALNWEAADHGSNWANFFYASQPNSGSNFTQAHLHADVLTDVVDSGVPVNAFLSTSSLPNWGGLKVNHAITIIGYNDTTATYTYVDTCGYYCTSDHGSNGGRVWTVSQTTLFNAMKVFTDGGWIW
jgi:hypothetical protein